MNAAGAISAQMLARCSGWHSRANSRFAQMATNANGVISPNTINRPIHGVLMHMVRVQKDSRAFQTQGNP